MPGSKFASAAPFTKNPAVCKPPPPPYQPPWVPPPLGLFAKVRWVGRIYRTTHYDVSAVLPATVIVPNAWLAEGTSGPHFLRCEITYYPPPTRALEVWNHIWKPGEGYTIEFWWGDSDEPLRGWYFGPIQHPGTPPWYDLWFSIAWG